MSTMFAIRATRSRVMLAEPTGKEIQSVKELTGVVTTLSDRDKSAYPRLPAGAGW